MTDTTGMDDKIDWEALYHKMCKLYADASCEIARLDIFVKELQQKVESLEYECKEAYERNSGQD